MTTTDEVKPLKKTAGMAKPKSTRADMTKVIRARITSLLDTYEQQMKDGGAKVSASDYIRLLQLQREFDEQKPRDIEVKWVDSLSEKSDSEG